MSSERCKERNRDHARKTRLRKKIALDNMKDRVTQLQQEMIELKALTEERDTASILLCLGDQVSKSESNEMNSDGIQFSIGNGYKIPVFSMNVTKVIAQLRVAVRLEAAAKKRADHLSSLRNQALVKLEENSAPSGMANNTDVEGSSVEKHSSNDEYDSHEDDDDDDDEDEEPLVGENVITENGSESESANPKVPVVSESNPKSTPPTLTESQKAEEAERLRKERNKIHARLTRGRKKLFTTKMAELISFMEAHNQRLRNKLRVAAPDANPFGHGLHAKLNPATPVGRNALGSVTGPALGLGMIRPSPMQSIGHEQTHMKAKVAQGTSASFVQQREEYSRHLFGSDVSSRAPPRQVGRPNASQAPILVTPHQLQQIQMFLQHSSIPSMGQSSPPPPGTYHPQVPPMYGHAHMLPQSLCLPPPVSHSHRMMMPHPPSSLDVQMLRAMGVLHDPMSSAPPPSSRTGALLPPSHGGRAFEYPFNPLSGPLGSGSTGMSGLSPFIRFPN